MYQLPAVDLVIKNARIVTSNGVMDGGVAVDEGKIVAVTSDTTLLDSSKVIDAGGLLLLPGLVDPECHMGATRPIMEDMISGEDPDADYNIIMECIAEDLVYRQTANPNATDSEFDGYRYV
mgnify:CR=1 FL=1